MIHEYVFNWYILIFTGDRTVRAACDHIRSRIRRSRLFGIQKLRELYGQINVRLVVGKTVVRECDVSVCE